MIEKILEITRAKFPHPPKTEIYFYFPDLYEHIKKSYPKAELPEVLIVHSLNKQCETFKYGDLNYIVYDQYLGQCFNKFNRLIYHEGDLEAKAYLCKLLGEEYYLINDIKNCIPYLVSYYANSKASFTQLPMDFMLKKFELIQVQESFVLFHEFAHSLIFQNKDLLLNAKSFLEKNESARLIMKMIKEKQNQTKPDDDLTHFYEEFTSDLIALELTYTYYSKGQSFTINHIIEGILLAFLYLRTLIDMKQKALGMYQKGGSLYHLFTKLRYNLIREYYVDSFEQTKNNPPQLIELYKNWEEKIDMKVVLFLTAKYKKDLKKALGKNSPPFTAKLAKKLLKLSD